jgi:molybdopterin synthase catalytic subunit
MPHMTDQPIDLTDWRACSTEGLEGASVEFQGLVRREEGGVPIACLEYEAYAPMAEHVIARLVEEARRRWPVHQVYVQHRFGCVPVGHLALFVGVRAAHRRDAFDACRVLVDEIKREIPVWKTAIRADGTRLNAPCVQEHPHA